MMCWTMTMTIPQRCRALLRHRKPAISTGSSASSRRCSPPCLTSPVPHFQNDKLLAILSRRRLLAGLGSSGGRVVFTRFFDSLTDIVDRCAMLIQACCWAPTPAMAASIWSHALLASCQSSSHVEHRFVRRQIDVLVCTDAAAEGLNLQTADLLVNFDLPRIL